MKRIVLIDSDLKATYDEIYTQLAHKIEFMQKWHNSDNEKMKERIKESCSPDILWDLQQKLHKIEKKWYRGEIFA